MISLPEQPFDKYRVCVVLLPELHSIEKYGDIRLRLQVTTIKNISYTILYGRNGEKLFSPWYMMKDRFGGNTGVNETVKFNGVERPKILDFASYGKFIREPNARFPTWIGYFDNHYQENREWRKSGMKQVLEYAEWERVLTPELESDIRKYRFEKQQ